MLAFVAAINCLRSNIIPGSKCELSIMYPIDLFNLGFGSKDSSSVSVTL